MSSVVDKFLRYVKIDTQSWSPSDTFPSTEKQKDLGRLLTKELQEMGASDVKFDEQFGYVYATIPSTLKEGKTAPVLGFISHMDTAMAVSGKDVKPRIVENYPGGDIVLNEALGIVTSVSDFPALQKRAGKTLIVTDGTTLLGADDKAGIAEILQMAEDILRDDLPHGTVKIAFTPDEEIGNGPVKFDVAGFGCDFAYTVDGGDLGELEYENFNGASAHVAVKGLSVHPGSAKNKMINAMTVAMEFASLLPKHEVPENTEGYEGFAHLVGMQGEIEHATLDYIIRDHDMEKFEAKKARFQKIADYLNDKYGAGTVVLNLTDTYYNMKQQIAPHMFLIEDAEQAMRDAGVEPLVVPIRGGTDGARLSFMGLPCPNLSTGGHNFHGRFEYIPVQSMDKMVEVLLNLVRV